MNELNEITYKGKCIAHHFWDKESGWLVVFEDSVSEDRRKEFEKNIQETADKNEIKVEFN